MGKALNPNTTDNRSAIMTDTSVLRIILSSLALPALLAVASHAADPQELANRANEAMVAEEWDEASRLLDRALELAGDAPELWIGSGFARIRLEETEEARQRYETALDLYLERATDDPDNAGLVMNVGYTLVLLNRRDEAIDYLNNAAEKNPDQPMYRNFPEVVEGLEANFSQFIVPPEEIVEEPDGEP